MIVIIDTNRVPRAQVRHPAKDYKRALTRKFHIHNGASPWARTEADLARVRKMQLMLATELYVDKTVNFHIK